MHFKQFLMRFHKLLFIFNDSQMAVNKTNDSVSQKAFITYSAIKQNLTKNQSRLISRNSTMYILYASL